MVTTNETQRTYWIEAQELDLSIQVNAFLLDRRIRGLAVGTLRFYKQKLALFLKYCFEQDLTTIYHISPTTIRSFLLWLDNTGHNPGGVHGFFRALRAFLRWWEEEHEPENWRNPIAKVKGPKQNSDPLPPADWEDIRLMVMGCKDGKTAKRDKALLLFLVDTGLRASETLSLDTDDFDTLTGGVRVKKGKGGKERTVFVGKRTRQALRKYLKSKSTDGPLWQTVNGGRLTYDGLRAMVIRRSEQVGVSPPSLHGFRRLFALACLRNGMDLRRLQELMGHSTLHLLQRYTQLLDVDLQTAHREASPVDRGW